MKAQHDANSIIVALDVPSAAEALELVDQIGPAAEFYKVGMELYAGEGMEIVEQLASFGKRVFLDLKLYDIPETVKRATREICRRSAVKMLTVHGSRRIMEAAREGCGDSETQLLAVTVLTSFDQEDLADLGYEVGLESLVDLRVKKAMAAGINGIVCSSLDVARVRQIGGARLTLVTPGVRSAGFEASDQKRIATPDQALRNGADYVVIGRQITRAKNPRLACEEVLSEVGRDAAICVPHTN